MNNSENFQTEAVKKINSANELLINNCLDNFTELELQEVFDSITLLKKQKLFWLKHNNYTRYLYDLHDFAQCLLEKVVKVESKIQGKEFEAQMRQIVPNFFKK